MLDFTGSKLFKQALFTILLTAGIFQESNASHTAGFEMFYRHKISATSDSTYEFTLVYYRNCAGFTPAPPTIVTISAKAASINRTGSISTSRLPTTGTGVPALQPRNLFNCTLANTFLCFEEYVYRGEWTSPERANDWIFSFQLCCRPFTNGPANIGYNSTYIECGLNNLDFPDYKSKNSSPIFHNRRPNHPGHLMDTIINPFFRTLCTGVFYTIDQSAKEYQGDSVTYSFFQPQGNGGVPVTYINSWSLVNPMPVFGSSLVINPQTGIIPVTPGSPTGTGIYVIGIEAKEWRYDTIVSGSTITVVPKQIGYVRREITIMINDSTCRRDSVHPKDIYLDTINADKKLKVRFQNGISYQQNSLVRCATLSPDGSEFRIVDSSNYVHPFDTTLRYIGVISANWNCQAGLTEEIELTLSAPITCGKYYLILRKGTDLDVLQSECGFWEKEFSAARIFTDSMSTPNLGPNVKVCKWTPFTLELDAGPGYASYYWNTWDTTRKITVSYAKEYWVHTKDNFNCIYTDTILVKEKDCDPKNPQNYPTNFSKKVVDEIDLTSSLNELYALQIRMYPNPSTGLLNIELNKSITKEEIRIYDLIGNRLTTQLRQISSFQIEIDLGDFKSGIYFIQILDGDNIIRTERIVLNSN